MSVTDPLLKELKGSVLKLVQTAGSDGITDNSAELQLLCQNLERTFQRGLLRTYTLGFSKEPESWDWLEELPSYINETTVTFSYVSALNIVKSCQKVVTARGKLRLLIRVCLVKKCLHIPVELLVRQRPPGLIYDKEHSILGDEILGEIFLSVLLQCSRLKFELDINNASFLDETWALPAFIQMEFVPCRALGICVSFVRGKAVIVSRKSNGVAAEDDKIEVGDILDELNGCQITIQRKGTLPALMRKSSGQPIKAAIIKARVPNTQELYPPIVGLLRQAHLDPDELLSQYISKSKSEESEKSGESIRPGFEVLYIGSINTGKRGDVRQIDMAIKSFVHNRKRQLNQPCLFEIQEVGLKVTDRVHGKIIEKHSYMEISSCGRTLSFNNYFAYIAGEENCSIAKNFTCYVFHSANEENVKTILQSIGQGFQRTHYAV